MSNRVKILLLEADNADSETVTALVGIVREVQGGGGMESAAAPLVLEAPASESSTPPLALPAAKRVYKARPPKQTSAPSEPGDRKRAGNAGGTILAALRKSSRPDLAKLALAVYGDAGKTTKVKQVLGYMAGTGKIKSNGDGTYTVNG